MVNDQVYLLMDFVQSCWLTCFDRDWRDPKWTSSKAVANGLETSVREQRHVLMGDNIIDIEGKSIIGLLLDEVRAMSLCQ